MQGLADVVKSHLDSGLTGSTQLSLRCPLCVNATCGQAKQFISDQQPALDMLRKSRYVMVDLLESSRIS